MVIHQLENSSGYNLYNGFVYHNQFCDLHFHNCFEFMYVIDGSIISIINSTEITLKKGECILISPNVIHKLKKDTDVYFFIGAFSSDFVQAFMKKENYSLFYKFIPEKEALDYWTKYIIFTGTPDLYMLKSCLYSICHQAIKHSEKSLESDSNHQFIMSVNNYITQHLTESFSRKDIADALNYEEHYFSTLFNNNFSMGFNTYINIFRIEHACTLLSHTKASIADIAFECGYSTIRSFNRTFKSVCGKTPTEYRKTQLTITEFAAKIPPTVIF